jgi:hypothetical protein
MSTVPFRTRPIAVALLGLTLAAAAVTPAGAASATEMQELVRLLRANGPAGKTIIARGLGAAIDEPLIAVSHGEGDDGRVIVTIAFESRVGMSVAGDGGPDKGPGACNVVLQDVDGDGIPDIAEFHCDRISAEMPKALSVLGQPLFDNAVRALIRRLTTV